VVDDYREAGKPFNMGMVFPVSAHNYELRYWLASGKIHPGFYSPNKVVKMFRVLAIACRQAPIADHAEVKFNR